MIKEIKICLPFYKIAYSVFFIAVLSLIRGVSFTNEIGIALEPQIALLAIVFCADTYVQEIAGKRSEVERLYPMKNRIVSIFRRIGVQVIYLLTLAVVGYGMFCIIQNPVSFTEMQSNEQKLFGSYMGAVAITVIFWGILSHTLSCLFRSMWAGIGGCLFLWILTNSTIGIKFLGKWNLFSYAFRDLENESDLSWICGKIVCIVFCMIAAVMFPNIIKKRG